MDSRETTADNRAERWTLVGSVQGFGIRPAVARLAVELALTGTVRNAMRGVIIELEGKASRITEFGSRLRAWLVAHAKQVSFEREAMPPSGHRQFSIIGSESWGHPQTAIPVDLKICKGCLADLRNPSNRRFGYAFTSCTDCGPRYSILRAMPYDRERTSMQNFPMCQACWAEYRSPDDRRFHSQTNCCRECGPSIRFSKDRKCSKPEEALDRAVDIIRGGGIIAIKGLGGYQLLCDATSEEAVRRLRLRKRRPSKPLAVMLNTLEQAASFATLSRCEQQSIDSQAGPIVLAAARIDAGLAESIHPGIRTLGVMLPTTALHASLSDRCSLPLVVTSGNLEGEPLVYKPEDAEHRLSETADGFLHHDREIVRPIDDSVVRCMNERAVSIRAARGLTPMVVNLKTDAPLLAVGGNQKVSIALSNGWQTILGPHLGDLASARNREHFDQHCIAIQDLYAVHSRVIGHDMHPDYFSTRWANEKSQHCFAVQHHHAHIVAGMLEHGWLEETVLGIAMDGTGWGENGLVLGGEILLATATDFERIGALKPFPLLGGEAAIRDPYRSALALLQAAMHSKFDEAMRVCFGSVSSPVIDPRLLNQRRFSPMTTSVGRLFDGAAAIAVGRFRPHFEGELAMRWESLCDLDEPQAYPLAVTIRSPAPLDERFECDQRSEPGQVQSQVSRSDAACESALVELDWRPMIRSLYQDRMQNVPAPTMAMRFHRGLAAAIKSVIDLFPEYRVVLSGGIFQNRVLVELIDSLVAPDDRKLGWSGKIPPNDGGLSIGQLSVAAARRRRCSYREPGLKKDIPSCA